MSKRWMKKQKSELLALIERQENRKSLLREGCKAWVRCQRRIKIANRVLAQKWGMGPSQIEEPTPAPPLRQPVKEPVSKVPKVSRWQRIKMAIGMWWERLILKLKRRR